MREKRIMIVDRNPDVRWAIACGLEQAFRNIGIIEAEDGEEALERMADRPHVVVTSLRLAKLNGSELIRIAREQDYAAHFVVYTGDNLTESETLPRDVQVFYKPSGGQALIKHVRQLLRRAA